MAVMSRNGVLSGHMGRLPVMLSSEPVAVVSEYQEQSDCSQALYHKIVKKYYFRQKTKAQFE